MPLWKQAVQSEDVATQRLRRLLAGERRQILERRSEVGRESPFRV